MGNAAFYYYPQPDGRRLVTVDLGESLGELFSDWTIDTVTGNSMDGGMFRSVGRGVELITIQRDRSILGEELISQLWALQNHLDRGFNVAFTADTDHSCCIPVTHNPTSGDNQITVGADTFSSMWGIQSPSVGQRYVLSTGGPGVVTEMIKVDASSVTATSGGSVDPVDSIVFTYQSPVFLRWWRSWAMLKRPQADVGKNIVTNEGGRLWSLSIRLVTNNGGLFAMHPLDTWTEFPFRNDNTSGIGISADNSYTLDSFDGQSSVSLVGSRGAGAAQTGPTFSKG